MNSSIVLAKNFISSVAARVIVPFGSFAVFISIARMRGLESVGKYTLVVTLFFIFQLFTSLGLGPLIVRHIAQEHDRPEKIYAGMLAIGLLSFIFWGPIFVLTAFVAGYPQDVFISTIILAFTLPFGFVAMANESFFMGLEKFEYIPVINALEALFMMAASVAVLVCGLGITALSAVLACGRIISSLTGTWLLKTRVGLSLWKMDRAITIRILRMAPPFFLNYGFGMLFFRMDILVLSLTVSALDLGLYSAAAKIYQIAVILPDGFVNALYPRLSKAATGEHIYSSAMRVIRYALVCITPFLLAVFVFGKELLGRLFGQASLPAEAALGIMIWTLLPYVANSILANVYMACNQQWITAVLTVLATLANALMSFTFIKILGFKGAALATFVSLFLCPYVLVLIHNKAAAADKKIRNYLRCYVPAAVGGFSAVAWTWGGSMGSIAASLGAAAISSAALTLITREDLVWLHRKLSPAGSSLPLNKA